MQHSLAAPRLDNGLRGDLRRTVESGSSALALGGIALLPLVCWPDLEHPFSTPKLALLLCIDAILAVVFLARRDSKGCAGTWQPLFWIAAVSLSVLMGSYANTTALALALAGAPLFWAAGGMHDAARRLPAAIVAGAVAESAIALLQYAGADPLRALGWHAEVFANPRMRVYGTLGNPDFVAAWCCATLPFTCFTTVQSARSKRALIVGWGLTAFQVGAILATGSRAALVALPAEAIALLLFRGPGWKKWTALLPLAGVVLFLPGSRALDETVGGRLYLARISVNHAAQVPLTGYGPGAFELQFAHWQVEWLREHGLRDAHYAGPVDHAHNDYIEFLVEYGALGLVALLASCWRLGAFRRAARSGGCAGASYAAAAGFTGLLALSLIDFPLHRPAEWAVFWLFAGLLAHDPAANPHPQVQKGEL